MDVASTPDPVAAVLAAHEQGRLLALRTSGTTSVPRSVLRTTASWFDSFEHVAALSGLDASARVWVPGPLSATMNLFAAVHATVVGARLVGSPAGATHAQLTPGQLARALDEGRPLDGVRVVVAGDRLPAALRRRAVSAGARVDHYYGAAELSFVAWGEDEDDLRPFPEVEVAVRDGRIWVRSPYLCAGYDGPPGPLRVAHDGFATVGDRGRLDGRPDATRLVVLGRDDGTVVTSGATVHVGDVEAALGPHLAGDVLVTGVPHAGLGSVVAAVLTDPADLPAARAASRAELPAAARPRVWLHRSVLPLTGAGKVDRARVAAEAAEGGVLRRLT